ncbi:hypothetical protein N7495_004489 [Penicillium taxi]|uniref:uncharacterized protein n=1 Tax=Penicillium taxi TaxID=168475 RepID=UPI002544DB23|nr:uncharacterized protein N7495_004489 [Penicillium taxi]KAJ5899745.1 hypothetical protein N7495_004489 [Penicillium taxi]
MRLLPRGYSVLATGSRGLTREAGTHSLMGLGRSSALCRSRLYSGYIKPPSKEYNVVSTSSALTRLGQRPNARIGTPQALLAQTQTRSFKRANYIEKIGDNEKAEEILESLHDQAHPQSKRAESLNTGKPEAKYTSILVHPQQPLSYLERLIQSELPPIEGAKGQLRPPAVSFIALQHEDNSIKPKKRIEDDVEPDNKDEGAKKEYSGKAVEKRRRSREEDSETYSYPRKTDTSLDPLNGEAERFVRWSQATEVGDFIRDAARAREFIVSIEGSPAGLGQIRITVPSFLERTYFLRMRLRKISRHIQALADIKHECDELAHRGAQRVAVGGFGVLSVWWGTVYMLTFQTELGWDTMEPVTYLVSLSAVMGGYLWFLYHNREISYKSALEFTVSTRQKKLYEQHNVDLQLWENLIDEGKSLRREIKSIAAEYDAEWNERADEQDERVTEALKSNKDKKKEKDDEKDKDEEEEED